MSRKFIYHAVPKSAQGNDRKESGVVRNNNNCMSTTSATASTMEIDGEGRSLQNGMDEFEFDDDDDITNTMTDADLQKLEIEASRKLGLVTDEPVDEIAEITTGNVTNVAYMKHTNDNRTYAPFNNFRTKQDAVKMTTSAFKPVVGNERIVESHTKPSETKKNFGEVVPIVNNAKNESDLQNSQLQQLASQLQEYKCKVEQLEENILTKDGELKLLQCSLEEHRQENAKKSAKLAQLTQTQHAERMERESHLTKEVASLKTRLSFQEQELKEQSNRLLSQKQSSSVKRKADIANTSVFDLDNSFLSSQMSCSKVPRLERRTENRKGGKQVKKEAKTPDVKTNICTLTTNKMVDNPTEINISMLKCGDPKPEPTILTLPESRACNVVKKLVLTHTCDTIADGSQDETWSLLNLLKYPLKQLPQVLKAHSMNYSLDQPLSQFPMWQTQVRFGQDSDGLTNNEELDLDSGKYNLVSQGIFLLLGLSSFSEKNLNNLGILHILVFLELYISSYIFTRHDSENETDQDCILQSASDQSEGLTTVLDEQDMILQTLQILKLLFYSAPGLVKCVLNRTSDDVFAQDVIVIEKRDADGPVEAKGTKNRMKDESTEEFEDCVGSFRSLLLSNLEKLTFPSPSDRSVAISHAALEVLITMTSFCSLAELERISLLLRRGSLTKLLTKDCGMCTVSHVMSLISNLLACKDLDKLLCSHTDECILLRIYQCVCEEEDDNVTDESWRNFLLQFVQFLKGVSLSHSGSIKFLLETYCQCSAEIVRCLVLVLHDKVNYLLDLDNEKVVSDESLSILRNGIIVLVTLCTHSSYTADHKLDVEPHYSELLYKTMMLFENIRHFVPELEALGLQDLLYMEQIDEIEWSQGSDDEDEDDDECMVVDG